MFIGQLSGDCECSKDSIDTFLPLGKVVCHVFTRSCEAVLMQESGQLSDSAAPLSSHLS